MSFSEISPWSCQAALVLGFTCVEGKRSTPLPGCKQNPSGFVTPVARSTLQLIARAHHTGTGIPSCSGWEGCSHRAQTSSWEGDPSKAECCNLKQYSGLICSWLRIAGCFQGSLGVAPWGGGAESAWRKLSRSRRERQDGETRAPGKN